MASWHVGPKTPLLSECRLSQGPCTATNTTIRYTHSPKQFRWIRVTYQLGAWEIWDRSCLSPISSKGHGQIFAYWVQISIVENPSFRICMSDNTWRSPLFSESIRFFSSSSLLTFFLNFGNSCRRSSLTSSRDFSWWFKPEKENNLEKSALLHRLQIWPTSVCHKQEKPSFTIIGSLR